jgi:hypothetical protein
MRAVKVVSELKATDWILQRWAVSVGDGLYDAPWTDVPQSRVPVLNDQLAIAVDQLILRAGPKTSRLIGYWYRTALPKTVIAERIGCCRDTIYVRWNAALHYFRGRFLESPLSELRLIARTDLDDVTISSGVRLLLTSRERIPTAAVAIGPTFGDIPDRIVKAMSEVS